MGLSIGSKPELLIYEQHNGDLRLVGVEFLVLAAQWNDPAAGNPPGAPVLQGQLFNYVGAPNRLRPGCLLRAARVGVAEQTPKGPFGDFDRRCRCDQLRGRDVGINHSG